MGANVVPDRGMRALETESHRAIKGKRRRPRQGATSVCLCLSTRMRVDEWAERLGEWCIDESVEGS